MIKEFVKEFKGLKKDNITEFINGWTNETYSRPFLVNGFYKIKLAEYKPENKNNDYAYYWRIDYAGGKEILSLAPFEAYGSDCNSDELSLAWKKHLHKTCPHYLEAYLDNAAQKANKVIEQAKKEIDQIVK